MLDVSLLRLPRCLTIIIGILVIWKLWCSMNDLQRWSLISTQKEQSHGRKKKSLIYLKVWLASVIFTYEYQVFFLLFHLPSDNVVCAKMIVIMYVQILFQSYVSYHSHTLINLIPGYLTNLYLFKLRSPSWMTLLIQLLSDVLPT